MLEPQARRLLLESLRPPEGYALDCAVGTTYSLDLLALLSVPLAFTYSEWEDREGNPTDDDIALLESVKRHADRICIFCQAGEISVPKKDQRLFAYLEQSVVEVTPRKKLGVFHPKVWLLRYVSRTDAAVRYRFLCLSRNLTFDRSWDTALVMDGILRARKVAYSVNHPLGDFIKALPGLAVLQPVADNVQQIVGRLQEEVRKVEFEPPEGFEDFAFWPLGLADKPVWPFGTDRGAITKRMLIISPFVRDGFLKRITEKRQEGNCILVSRSDEMDQVPRATLDRFKKYTLSSASVPDGEDSNVEGDSELTGLHAKLFLMDDSDEGRHMARLWTGSANATNAAFPDQKDPADREKGNVEFLVELAGPRGKFGIDRLLTKEKGTTCLIDMLDDYKVPDEIKEVDSLKKQLEQELDIVRRILASATLRGVIVSNENSDSYSVDLYCDKSLQYSRDISIKCWPVTYQEHLAADCISLSGKIANFGGVTMDALTAFYAFEMSLVRDNKKASSRFILKAALIGLPDGRLAHLVRSLLKDKNRVLRMFLLLLADQDLPPGEGGGRPKVPGGSADAGGGSVDIPLLESLLLALDRSPEKIDRIHALVNDIMASPEGEELLPAGFGEIWPAIFEARKGLL